MKRYLLLLAFGVCFSHVADAQTRPGKKNKRTFNHTAEAGKGKNSKARFRHESNRPVIDLNPRNAQKTSTTKAPRPYKYSKGI